MSEVSDCLRRETNNEIILTTQSADQYRKLHSVLCQECMNKTHSSIFGEI